MIKLDLSSGFFQILKFKMVSKDPHLSLAGK
jgi:hypothetical protein